MAGTPKIRRRERQDLADNTSSFPRKRESSLPFPQEKHRRVLRAPSLDFRFRGNDEELLVSPDFFTRSFAGMTKSWRGALISPHTLPRERENSRFSRFRSSGATLRPPRSRSFYGVRTPDASAPGTAQRFQPSAFSIAAPTRSRRASSPAGAIAIRPAGPPPQGRVRAQHGSTLPMRVLRRARALARA